MKGVKDQEPNSVYDRVEFHLIDLVPGDCCQTERLDLEAKLQRLEEALSSWLRAKIKEIESEPSSTSLIGTAPQLRASLSGDEIARRGGHITGHEEVIPMSTDERDILELLQTELDFLEKGGYGRSVRTPWKPTSPFRDSLTCVNYALPEKAHPCSECQLIDFVPPDHRGDELPCHHIPLNDTGDTAEDLENDQVKLERALKHWLRARIKEIEAERCVRQPSCSRVNARR